MPSYEAAGSRIIHLGYGDIGMIHARNEDKNFEDEVAFVVHQEKHEIGADIPEGEYEGKLTDSLECPVRIIFDDVRSLDALILTLQELRPKIVAGQQLRTVASYPLP